MIKRSIVILIVLSVFLAGTAAAETNDLGTIPPESSTIKLAAASSENTVDNGDGTFTYTQTVDESSTAPHYIQPASGGFEIYSWWNEDYGWNHTFDICNEPNMTIYSVQLVITAWDVDSDVEDGEFDHLTADGVDMNPVYLQGFNNQWSVTTFDINPALLTDDCALEIFMDIDMTHNSSFWATTLDKSELVVLYSYGNNRVPCEPSVEIEPSECVDTNDDLTVSITGPSPADPDGDNVTYTYRWFVDTGTGFLDDEFALGVDHTGNMVPAADTSTGQIWMVQVTPVDEYGAKGPFVQVAFNEIVEECGEIPGGEIPEFPTLALPIAAIIGLAFVFQRSRKE